MVGKLDDEMAGIAPTNTRIVPLMESPLSLMIYPKVFGCNDLKEKAQKKGCKDFSIYNARYDM